ncbi:ribosome recycling factor, partial [Staphylococcus epidermidis]|uniref:ribosome recycling factor n=1 Tax=Staphylococcus epidermidis TaxID=1282 RepID=UPI0011A574A9
MSDIIKHTNSTIQKSIHNLSPQLPNITPPTPNSNLLNPLTLHYYPPPTPLQQLATINLPEPPLLLISPYHNSSLPHIQKPIIPPNLPLNPTTHRHLIPISLPPLTQQTPKQLLKQLKKIP